MQERDESALGTSEFALACRTVAQNKLFRMIWECPPEKANRWDVSHLIAREVESAMKSRDRGEIISFIGQ